MIADIGRFRTALLSTHLLEDVTHLYQHVGVLTAGRMVFSGTKEGLVALLKDTEPAGTLGSDVERAYDALITGLGVAHD